MSKDIADLSDDAPEDDSTQKRIESKNSDAFDSYIKKETWEQQKIFREYSFYRFTSLGFFALILFLILLFITIGSISASIIYMTFFHTPDELERYSDFLDHLGNSKIYIFSSVLFFSVTTIILTISIAVMRMASPKDDKNNDSVIKLILDNIGKIMPGKDN